MFDSPNVAPLCCAPFVAIVVGIVVYSISKLIGHFAIKRSKKSFEWWNTLAIPLALFSVPIACFSSVALNIGDIEPEPWFSPSKNSVIGTWELTSKTIKPLTEWQNITVGSHSLIFYSDGTFQISNIPAFWGRFDQENGTWMAKYMSGNGTWELVHIEDSQSYDWMLDIRFLEIDGHEVLETKDQDWIVSFYFIGHLPPYTLKSFDGDYAFYFRKK